MKKQIIYIVALVLMVSVFTGCGSKSAENSGEASHEEHNEGEAAHAGEEGGHEGENSEEGRNEGDAKYAGRVGANPWARRGNKTYQQGEVCERRGQ